MPAFDLQNYVSVQERINAFWKDHPNGAIVTDLEASGDFEHVVMKASVYKQRPASGEYAIPDATGYAAEERGKDYKTGANFTSWHENSETSAIGRALANLGYATTQETRPSREEMTKTLTHSIPPEKPRQTATNATPIDVDTARMRRLHAVADKRGLNHDELHAIAQGRGRGSLKELTAQEMDAFTNWLEKVSPPALQVAIDSGRETATANEAAKGTS